MTEEEDLVLILLCDGCGGQDFNLYDDLRIVCANEKCSLVQLNVEWKWTEEEEEYVE